MIVIKKLFPDINIIIIINNVNKTNIFAIIYNSKRYYDKIYKAKYKISYIVPYFLLFYNIK